MKRHSPPCGVLFLYTCCRIDLVDSEANITFAARWKCRRLHPIQENNIHLNYNNNMAEFWESNFKDKQEMWGSEPADAAMSCLELFRANGANKILIPGFGYGRNAKPFADDGFQVTGIEISETAIELSRKHFGERIKVYHGSVGEMPFDGEMYDGIFCYALIHLLNADERSKLISDCYRQLRPNGYMVFISISKKDMRYGSGTAIDKDTFETKHGVNLFFYDRDSVHEAFGNYGLLQVEEICEPSVNIGNKPVQHFLQIICHKQGLE